MRPLLVIALVVQLVQLLLAQLVVLLLVLVVIVVLLVQLLVQLSLCPGGPVHSDPKCGIVILLSCPDHQPGQLTLDLPSSPLTFVSASRLDLVYTGR